MNFLNTLGEKWNITLFHYRNHGAATGMFWLGLRLLIMLRLQSIWILWVMSIGS